MKLTQHPLPEDENIKVIELVDAEIGETGEQEPGWLQLFKSTEKRTLLFFYFLAAITGMLCVQLIWQIALLTIPQ